ncbi:hypothetical protein ACP70R_000406 [Stipagrostis hirtigluma subsp. patula]
MLDLVFARLLHHIPFSSANVKDKLLLDETCVHPRRFAKLMASCGATHDACAIWVTHGGSQGIACLIKPFMPPGYLSKDRACYFCHQDVSFPSLYDIGLIAQHLDISVSPQVIVKCMDHIARGLKVVKEGSRQPIESSGDPSHYEMLPQFGGPHQFSIDCISFAGAVNANLVLVLCQVNRSGTTG